MIGYLGDLFRTIVRDQASAPSPSSAAARAAAWIAGVRTEQGDAGVARELDEALKDLLERMDTVQVAVTGVGWVGGGIPSVERTLLDCIGAATREILLTAYSITSGSNRVLEALEKALATGVKCVLLVNQLEEQPADVRAFLLKVAREYPAVAAVYDWPRANGAEGLHAKVVVVDRSVALVGSANLSARGLVTAHELAVVVRGPAADLIGSVVDRVVAGGTVRRLLPLLSPPGSSSP